VLLICVRLSGVFGGCGCSVFQCVSGDASATETNNAYAWNNRVADTSKIICIATECRRSRYNALVQVGVLPVTNLAAFFAARICLSSVCCVMAALFLGAPGWFTGATEAACQFTMRHLWQGSDWFCV
jgi:hypothetical protein